MHWAKGSQPSIPRTGLASQSSYIYSCSPAHDLSPMGALNQKMGLFPGHVAKELPPFLIGTSGLHHEIGDGQQLACQRCYRRLRSVPRLDASVLLPRRTLVLARPSRCLGEGPPQQGGALLVMCPRCTLPPEARTRGARPAKDTNFAASGNLWRPLTSARKSRAVRGPMPGIVMSSLALGSCRAWP